MQRSSSSSRSSLVPLRVKNDGDIQRRSGSTGRSSLFGRSPGGRSGKSVLASMGLGVGGMRKAPGSRSGSGGASNHGRRASSGYGRNPGPESYKDPRPISDKSFKDRSIRQMIEFLVENGYPHSVTVKILQCPSSKDFHRTFEFLYNFVNSKFTLKKPDEEIPRVFKMLGYPFTLSKSNMLSPGSPHTWPLILAALTWLRQQIQFTTAVEPDTLLFPKQVEDFDSEPRAKMVFRFIEMTYQLFLQGQDTFDDEEAEISSKLRQTGIFAAVEQHSSENRRLREELRAMADTPDRLPNLRDEHSTLKADKTKLMSYITELETQHDGLKQKTTRKDAEIESQYAEAEAMNEEVARKQQIFDTQELSPTDVERINVGLQEQRHLIEAVKSDLDGLESEIWTNEVCVTKQGDSIEALRRDYNKMCQTMKLIPASAENATSFDLEMRMPFKKFGANNMEQIQQNKNALAITKSVWNDQVHEARAHKDGHEETLEQVKDMVSSSEQSISMLQAKLRRMETSVESEKLTIQREGAQLQLETDELQDRLSSLQSPGTNKRDLAHKSTQQNVSNEENGKRRKNETNELNKELSLACEMILTHRSRVQNNMAMFARVADELLAKEAEALRAEGISPLDAHYLQ